MSLCKALLIAARLVSINSSIRDTSSSRARRIVDLFREMKSPVWFQLNYNNLNALKDPTPF
eukprot:2530-Heterococcus_DN1.PRE.1